MLKKKQRKQKIFMKIETQIKSSQHKSQQNTMNYNILKKKQKPKTHSHRWYCWISIKKFNKNSLNFDVVALPLFSCSIHLFLFFFQIFFFISFRITAITNRIIISSYDHFISENKYLTMIKSFFCFTKSPNINTIIKKK